MPDNPNTILALETAVQGGSISLLKGDKELDFRVGDADVSRAEDVLVAINDILRTNEIDKSELGLIAVSNGPGSYTGIRIGLATALGLKNALNIETAGISILEAMTGQTKNTITAVPIGKRDVCWRLLSGDLKTGSDSDFLTLVQQNPELDFFVQSGLAKRFRKLTEDAADVDRLTDAGTNLAYFIGRAAVRLQGPHELRPIFATVHQ
jgi:tRNA threonylcarbamoyl adenosine modification protein YeaZ